MIAETSRQAYKSLGKKKLGRNQEIVYNAIKTLGRATNEEIGEYLKWPDKSVTGRTNDLFRLDMVAVDGRKPTKSGNSAKAWVVKDLNDKKLKVVYGPAVTWDD